MREEMILAYKIPQEEKMLITTFPIQLFVFLLHLKALIVPRSHIAISQ